jgi:hypothetical protein
MKSEERKARRARREEASLRMSEVEAVAFKVRRNDPGCIHVTVWLSANNRVEWWPSTGKWQNGQTSAMAVGNFDDFAAWVKSHAGEDGGDDFDLIEDE